MFNNRIEITWDDKSSELVVFNATKQVEVGRYLMTKKAGEIKSRDLVEQYQRFNYPVFNFV